MDLFYDIYKLTFLYRYFNEFFSLGLFWIVGVIGYNYVIIRDILTKNNPLYLVIFWISFSLSIVFPNVYLELLFIVHDYINPNFFHVLKDIKIVMLGYVIFLTPIIFIFLYLVYFILYIFRSRLFRKNDFLRIRGSKKHWDVSISNTILTIVVYILIFGTIAYNIFIIGYSLYVEESETTNRRVDTKPVLQKDIENIPIILNDVVSDNFEIDDSDFMNQEEIDTYREAQYKKDDYNFPMEK